MESISKKIYSLGLFHKIQKHRYVAREIPIIVRLKAILYVYDNAYYFSQ